MSTFFPDFYRANDINQGLPLNMLLGYRLQEYADSSFMCTEIDIGRLLPLQISWLSHAEYPIKKVQTSPNFVITSNPSTFKWNVWPLVRSEEKHEMGLSLNVSVCSVACRRCILALLLIVRAPNLSYSNDRMCV